MAQQAIENYDLTNKEDREFLKENFKENIESGTTENEWVKFISNEYDLPEKEVRRLINEMKKS